MMRVIDMECSVPRRAGDDAAAVPAPGAAAPERPAGYGMANYERIFRSRQGGGDARPTTERSAFVDQLARVGIVRAVPFGASNDEVAELLREYPDRFWVSPGSAGSTACAGCASWSAGCARSSSGPSASPRSSTASRPAIDATTRCTPRPSSSAFPCGST